VHAQADIVQRTRLISLSRRTAGRDQRFGGSGRQSTPRGANWPLPYWCGP